MRLLALTSLSLVLALVACGPMQKDENSNLFSSIGSWKGVLLSGYYNDSQGVIEAWDNATAKVLEILGSNFSANTQYFKRYTKDQKKVGSSGIEGISSLQSLESGLASLGLGESDGCFVFMTSHGSSDGAFSIEGGNSIRASQFFSVLESKCGSKKTAAIVSACYSGSFVQEAQRQNKPNLVVLSAASNVPSFGCEPGRTYTFYDQCVVEVIQKPEAKQYTWQKLYDQINSCVTRLEGGMTERSNPLVYIGSDMKEDIIFASSGSSNGQLAQSSDKDAKIFIKGTATSGMQILTSLSDEYDRVVACTGVSATSCDLVSAATFIQTIDGRAIFKINRTITANNSTNLFIFGFKKGNSSNQSDKLDSIKISAP